MLAHAVPACSLRILCCLQQAMHALPARIAMVDQAGCCRLSMPVATVFHKPPALCMYRPAHPPRLPSHAQQAVADGASKEGIMRSPSIGTMAGIGRSDIARSSEPVHGYSRTMIEWGALAATLGFTALLIANFVWSEQRLVVADETERMQSQARIIEETWRTSSRAYAMRWKARAAPWARTPAALRPASDCCCNRSSAPCRGAGHGGARCARPHPALGR
jgi:hypothetical protein